MKDFLSTQWPDYIGGGKEVAMSSIVVEDVAKVVESFENPKVSEEKVLYRESETGDVWNDHSLGLEERMVKLVEKGFDKFTPEEQGLWQHIKRAFERMLNSFFRTLHLPNDVWLGDAELRQMMRTKPKMSLQVRIGPTSLWNVGPNW
jgi:hypothetical protein